MTTSLPSPLGSVTISPDSVRLWSADAGHFSPVVCATTPHREETAFRPPQLDVAAMPLSLPPEAPFIPAHYEIHLHSQLCLSCGSGHEWSCTYAFNEQSSRLSAGRRIDRKVRVTRFSYNVPTRVVRAPLETVPACQECALANLDLSHLPRPSDTEEYKRILNPLASPAPEPVTPEPPKIAKRSASPAPRPSLTLNNLF